MGGCRCSYRSCKVRSDGKTHMFHFPVFDKIRCHQWIRNAHKPEYLNLKVSQLRNRVICQHHFNDDNFMNYMRDKLKNTAVPTENGPFCEFSEPTPPSVQHDKPVIAINADDIENDNTLYYLEKKAHSEVKYGDFLISDVTELLMSGKNIIDDYRIKDSKKDTNQNPYKYESRMTEDYNKYTINYTNEEVSNPLFNKGTPNPTILAIEYDELPNKLIKNDIKKKKVNKEIVHKTEDTMNTGSTVVYPSHEQINPDKVVKIISQKTFSEPVIVGGRLEPISPSMILKRPRSIIDNFEQKDCDNKSTMLETLPNLDSQVINNNNVLLPTHVGIYEQNIPMEYRIEDHQANNYVDGGINHNQLEYLNAAQAESLQFIDPNNSGNQIILENVENPNAPMVVESQSDKKAIIEHKNIENEIREPTNKSLTHKLNIASSPSKSILRTRMPPEKLAAIEDKRKFNMKLRDVITSCLNNLEEQEETKIQKNASVKKLKPKTTEVIKNEPRVTRSQDNVVSYLESRLQRMESVLLNKIDHNTNRINELKRVVKPRSGFKNVSTQTYKHLDDHTQKQQLYREISKYLSSDAKSIIFEELFVNVSKCTLKNDSGSSSSPRKRRRR